MRAGVRAASLLTSRIRGWPTPDGRECESWQQSRGSRPSRSGRARQPRRAEGALRELHRRPLDRAGQRRVLRERDARRRASRSRRCRARPAKTSSSRSTPHTPRRTPGARPPTTERSRVLNKIADAIEENLELLAVAESWENGKPVRETLAADIPLAADHFRYFASVIRGEEGSISEIDKNTIAYHFHEPLGVVGQIIPFNFPLLMAAWKLAPALAAGNCVVLKPASPTPWSILKLMELLEDVVPAGVHQRRQRPRRRDRQGARDEQADREDRLHRRDGDGPPDHAVRRPEHHPVDDRARRQVAEHLLRRRDGRRRRVPRQGGRRARPLRLQQGRGLHVPVAGPDRGVDLRRVHGRALERIAAIRQGHPLDPTRSSGPQVSSGAAREDRELRRDRQATRAPSC